jgi:hypothetical protein
LKEPNLAKDAALDLFSAFDSYSKGDIGGVTTTAIGLFKKVTNSGTARERTLMTKTSPADVIMFSGSKDTQTSYDNILFPFPSFHFPVKWLTDHVQCRYLPGWRSTRRVELGLP